MVAAFARLPRHDPASPSASTGSCSTSCATSSGKSGFGIGSAGLPAYNVLVEGYSQALDNDVVLSMKQANIPAVSRFVDTSEVDAYFEHEGHRTAVSQRALQVHTDPLLGHTQHRRRRLRRLGGLALRGRPRLDRDQRARRHARGGRPARPRHREDPLRLRRGQPAGPRGLPGRGGDRQLAGGSPQRVRRRGCATGGSRTPSASATTTRCSSTPSARAGSGSLRPDPRAGRPVRRRCATCRRSGRRPRRRAAPPAPARRGRRR